jgi:hypothetical protein
MRVNYAITVENGPAATSQLLNGIPFSAPYNNRVSKAVYQGLVWNSETVSQYHLNTLTPKPGVDTSTFTNKKFAITSSLKDVSGTYSYLVFLQDTGDKYKLAVQSGGIYKINNVAKTIEKVNKITPEGDLDINTIFEVYDSLAYKNPCKSTNCREAKIFTLEPYKGMISLLPFDLKEGRYIETKNLMPF